MALKKILSLLIISSIVITPVVAVAQTTPGGLNNGQTAGSAQTVGASQQFKPSVSLGSGSSFGGVSFSGVGSSILNCTNVSQKIVSTASKLLGKAAKGLTGKEVPVADSAATDQLKTANQISSCLDGIAYTVAHQLLQQVTNKTLNYINTGFGGNPLYVQDIGSYLTSIRNQELNSFLQDVPNSNPIFGNALRSIITQQVTGKTDGYINKLQNTPEAINYNNFQKNFTQGGWESQLNFGNNPIGAIFNAADTIGDKINTQQQNSKDELQRNNGFFDMKVCAEYKNNGQGAGNATVARGITVTGAPECVRYQTVTPGSIIAQQAAYITNSPARQLEYADKINEVLGSFFDQLLNKLFSNGLGGLKGWNSGSVGFGSSASGFGPGSNVVLGTNGQPLSNAAGSSSLGYQAGGSGLGVQDFDISRPQMLLAVLQTQYDYLNHAYDSHAALLKVVPNVGRLDYCLPGPNTLDADTNFSAFEGSLKVASSTIPGGIFGTGGATVNANGLYGTKIDLLDALKGATQRIPGTYGFSSPLSNISGVDIPGYIENAYDDLKTRYTTTFNRASIIDAFAATDTNPDFARDTITEAYGEADNLASYNQTSLELAAQYSDEEASTRDAIRELESIRAEQTAIVTAAKARYIASQAAAGTPVNMQCINSAYTINTAQLSGTPRIEGDSDATVDASAAASAYFYNGL